MTELSREAQENLTFIRKTVGAARFRGPFQEAGSWVVTLIRKHKTSTGLTDERREHCIASTADGAIERAKLAVEDDLEKARGA
jgi:hypothetical protein